LLKPLRSAGSKQLPQLRINMLHLFIHINTIIETIVKVTIFFFYFECGLNRLTQSATKVLITKQTKWWWRGNNHWTTYDLYNMFFLSFIRHSFSTFFINLNLMLVAYLISGFVFTLALFEYVLLFCFTDWHPRQTSTLTRDGSYSFFGSAS